MVKLLASIDLVRDSITMSLPLDELKGFQDGFQKPLAKITTIPTTTTPDAIRIFLVFII